MDPRIYQRIYYYSKQ